MGGLKFRIDTNRYMKHKVGIVVGDPEERYSRLSWDNAHMICNNNAGIGRALRVGD